MQTVVETPSYLTDAERLFSVAERATIVDRLAADPTCGKASLGENRLTIRLPGWGI